MAEAAFCERRKSIKALDEELLASGILFLTGSHDRYGHPIAIVPNKADEYLGKHYTVAHVVIVIRYYFSICYHGKETRGMAFVANLHGWKKESIKVLVDALDMAQDDRHGTVGVLYAIQPKARDLLKHFKKLTGLRASKRNPKIPRYETVCVSVPGELLRFMEVKNLTEDFAGSLQYNHTAWISFMKTMDDLEESINKTLDKLPEAHDKLSIMCEYDIPTSQSDAEALLSQIRVKYQNVMRNLNLEHMIDECKEVIKSLTDPHILPQYSEIMHTPSFTDTRKNLEQYEKQLIKSREELKTIWQLAEERVIAMGRVVKYKHKADQILSWLKEVGLPAIKEPAEIADCLSKAEILKTQYETGFLSVAKNVLWLSEKIQRKLDEAVLKNQSIISDLLPFSKTFLVSIEQFRKQTQNKYTVYLNVFDFYLASHKSPLSEVPMPPGHSMYSFILQLTRWYRRTLKFIPVQLLQQQSVIMTGFHDVVFHGSNAWVAAVNNFLLRHPAPKAQHLVKLKNILPVIDQINIRSQARLLVHRVGVLCMLLRDPTKVKLPDMQGVLRWRNQVLDGFDDITLNLNSSTLDLPELVKTSARTLPRQSNSVCGNEAAPKLKGLAVHGEGGVQRQYYSLDRQIIHRDLGSHSPSLPTNVHTRRQDEPIDLAFMDYDSLASEQGVLPLSTHRPPSHERYVSLGYGDNSSLPRSAENLDFLHRARPQSAVFTDSGFVNPHGEEENKSTQYINSVGLSAHHTILAQHKSLPNLKNALKQESPLTIDTVVNSNLEPEEKLNLMSRISLGENIELTPELYYKLYPNPEVLKPPRPSRSHATFDYATLPKSARVRNSGIGEPQFDAHHEMATRPRSAVESNTGYHGYQTLSWETRSRPLFAADITQDNIVEPYYAQEVLSRPIITQDTDTYQQPINRDSGFSEHAQGQRQSGDYLYAVTDSYRGYSAQHPRYQDSKHKLVPSNQQHSSGILRNKCSDSQMPKRACDGCKGKSQAVPNRRKPSKRSSIKVEEWMQRPEHQLEMTRGHDTDRSRVENDDSISSRQEEKRLNNTESYRSIPLVRTSYPQNAPSSLADSDLEGAESVLIERRLAELALEEAELDQDDLEISLRKTEQILQEQEELLKEYDLDLPASPNSTSSSATLLNEETIHATQVQEQQCPLVNPDNNASSDKTDPHREDSLSEESGVYTQSTDSRVRLYTELAKTGSNVSLNHLMPPHRAVSPNIRSKPHTYDGEPYGDDFLSSNGHLRITKEASLGDSSSQATVITEIHRNQSLSSNGSRSRCSSKEQVQSISRNRSMELAKEHSQSRSGYGATEPVQHRSRSRSSSMEVDTYRLRDNSQELLSNESNTIFAISNNSENSVNHSKDLDTGPEDTIEH